MIPPPYNGHYSFLKDYVEMYAPQMTGVYYVGFQDGFQKLIPLYVGRATGLFTSIRSRLLDHLRESYWRDATHFGYRLCSGMQAEELERSEIRIYQPRYNVVHKAVGF